MLLRSTLGLLALGLGLAWSGPLAAQGNDPLTRFLNGLFNQDQPQAQEDKTPAARPRANQSLAPSGQKVRDAAAMPAARPPVEGAAAAANPDLAKRPDRAAPVRATTKESSTQVAAPAVPAAAVPAVSNASSLPAIPAASQQQTIPTTPEAALDRLNAYFNSIDVLTASFVQTGNGQRSQGSLSLKRPGQLRFAYAPPSTLEIVSDGRSVAIRDKKLGTNDVYPIGQTPLKFLLQERFDLARDTKVRNVQTNPDGTIIVRFDDSATFGGTSKITLHFDARRNRLKEWTVVDPQGYETQVVLSDVNVVTRAAN
jgi:outer membrane lipoprotein-sorting protein